MRKTPAFPALFLTGLIAGVTLLTADNAGRGRQANRSAKQSADSIVTPVVGHSWLNHLHIKSSDSSLGRGAGQYAHRRGIAAGRDPTTGRTRGGQRAGHLHVEGP
jgi:hypothetical protein